MSPHPSLPAVGPMVEDRGGGLHRHLHDELRLRREGVGPLHGGRESTGRSAEQQQQAGVPGLGRGSPVPVQRACDCWRKCETQTLWFFVCNMAL